MPDVRMEIKTITIREDGCYSVLLWDGRPFAVSVERTFDDNRVVLPAGTFLCKRGGHRLGNGIPFETFEITGVEGHTGVLFHKGNWETDSEGCVLVGESFATLAGREAIAGSKGGFNELLKLVEGLNEFYVQVTGR